MRDRPDFPELASLGANAGPAARDAFKRATESRAAWLSCSVVFCAAIEHRRVKSHCSLGFRHRQIHPTLVPARHHQCEDCSPRDDDGCRGRRLASSSEENFVGDFRSRCTHRHVQRKPCLARKCRTSSSHSCSMRSVCFLQLSPPTPFLTINHFVVYGGKRGDCAAAQQTFEAYAAYVLP